MTHSPPTRALRLSIAFALSACLRRASAFATPPWRADKAVAALKPRRDANPTTADSVPPTGSMMGICNANHDIVVQIQRYHFGAYTKLRAKIKDGDEGGADSSLSEKILRATNKWTQRPKQTAKLATAKSKIGSRPKAKKVQKKSQNQQKKRKRAKKLPVEISARSLSSSRAKSTQTIRRNSQPSDSADAGGEENYVYEIPKTGYSLADRLENQSLENRENFKTTLTPIVAGIRDAKGGEPQVEFEYDEDGFPVSFREIGDGEGGDGGRRHEGVARIDTVSTLGSPGEEPVRWLVSLGEASGDEGGSFAMVDLPPFSNKLANEIRLFMDPSHNATIDGGGSNVDPSKKATLDAILLTSQQGIHYDDSPGVYVTRKSDLTKWKGAFPTAEVVMYRLDVPRECRDEVTQVLDGYGPWGWEEDAERRDGMDDESGVARCGQFTETGRPLTIEEWDDDTKAKVLTEGVLPPDDRAWEGEGAPGDDEGGDGDGLLYSPEAIREREERHRLLAVYTPGHTFGSVTYIFPRRGICCSGHALPLEGASSAVADDYGGGADHETPIARSRAMAPEGPRLDYRGYLATSASRPRQMSSALSLINDYIDRFRVVLPARGDVTFLDPDEGTRKRELMESVGLYQKISDIYSRLGIIES